MATETHNRARPSLEVKTDHHSVGGYPRTAFRTHRSPLPTSATPITAKPLPSPLHPSTPRYDATMTKHDRDLVESLDNRGRRGSAGSARPLSPIAEQSMASELVKITMNSPLQPPKPQALPITAPSTPSQPSPSGQRRQSIMDETRSMLLSGMSQARAAELSTVPNRRSSATSDEIQRARRQSLLVHQEKLQEWGHCYFGDVSNLHVLVAPAALRGGSSGIEAESLPNGLRIRALVRPRDESRKPFLIARTFDLDVLRSTLPNPVSTTSEHLGPPAPPDTPTAAQPSNSSPLSLRRRRSSVSSSDRTPLRSGPRPRSAAGASRARGFREVPFHYPYARAYLPILAAFMLSEYLDPGDSIKLPMPHPEAWHQTAAYVYTGEGELTEAVRRNILHLGGRA